MFQMSSPIITNGLYIIHCIDQFQHISALTLETVNRIRYKGEITFITHQNVFGSTFVRAVETKRSSYVYGMLLMRQI